MQMRALTQSFYNFESSVGGEVNTMSLKHAYVQKMIWLSHANRAAFSQLTYTLNK